MIHLCDGQTERLQSSSCPGAPRTYEARDSNLRTAEHAVSHILRAPWGTSPGQGEDEPVAEPERPVQAQRQQKRCGKETESRCRHGVCSSSVPGCRLVELSYGDRRVARASHRNEIDFNRAERSCRFDLPLPGAFRAKAPCQPGEIDDHPFMRSGANLFDLVARADGELDTPTIDPRHLGFARDCRTDRGRRQMAYIDPSADD